MPSEYFNNDVIGTVKDYDRTTRKVKAYIPKMMPGIPEDRRDLQILTNLGNPNIKIKYNKYLTLSSTIVVPSKDQELPMPEIGSHVCIDFLEDDFIYRYWTKWNYNGDYSVIEPERYNKLFDIQVENKRLSVYEEDNVIFGLPSGAEVFQSVNEETKQKQFIIKMPSNVNERLAKLEKSVGAPSQDIKLDPADLKGKVKRVEATGIYKKFEDNNAQINTIINRTYGRDEDDYTKGIRKPTKEYDEESLIKRIRALEEEIFGYVENGKTVKSEFDTMQDTIGDEPSRSKSTDIDSSYSKYYTDTIQKRLERIEIYLFGRMHKPLGDNEYSYEDASTEVADYAPAHAALKQLDGKIKIPNE